MNMSSGFPHIVKLLRSRAWGWGGWGLSPRWSVTAHRKLFSPRVRPCQPSLNWTLIYHPSIFHWYSHARSKAFFFFLFSFFFFFFNITLPNKFVFCFFVFLFLVLFLFFVLFCFFFSSKSFIKTFVGGRLLLLSRLLPSCQAMSETI